MDSPQLQVYRPEMLAGQLLEKSPYRIEPIQGWKRLRPKDDPTAPSKNQIVGRTHACPLIDGDGCRIYCFRCAFEMEDFLAVILSTIADVLLELVLDALFALIGRVLEDIFAGIRKPVPFVTAISAVLLGAASGELSLVIFPHPLVRPSKIHGISLLLSPMLTGFVMAMVGRGLRRLGKRTLPTETFTYVFLFAFAIALVRFVFVK